MTRDKAMMLLAEFLDGSLPRAEHQAIAQMMGTDAELRTAFEEEKLLDGLLRSQEWVHAQPHFTARVLERAGLPVAQGEAVLDRVLERLSAYAPAGTIVLVALLYGRAIVERLWDLWRGVLRWAGQSLGVSAFEASPALAATSLALVLIGVVIAFELSRRNESSA